MTSYGLEVLKSCCLVFQVIDDSERSPAMTSTSRCPKSSRLAFHLANGGAGVNVRLCRNDVDDLRVTGGAHGVPIDISDERISALQRTPPSKTLQLTSWSVASHPLALAAERRYVGRTSVSASRIRKSIPDLSVADFVQFPVWEFALDEEGDVGQDETTVRPWLQLQPIDPTDGMFVVRAEFVLADGTVMPGYLTPPVQGGDTVGTLQPVITSPLGQVWFWCGSIVPQSDYLELAYNRLGKPGPRSVFPIRFRSAVDLVGGPVSGELPGFIVLEDFQTGRTRIVA
jgi:hypothetical protein